MKLPSASAKYDPSEQNILRAAISQADRDNQKKNTDYEIGKARLFMRSPNGSRWQLKVADDGTVSAVPA